MAAGGVLVGRGYVSIRPEFEGDWSRSVNTRASSAGRSGAAAFSKAFGVGLKSIGALAGVAIGANLSTVAAGAAALAPALATAGAAAGALKLGLSGVGDAFKAAFADHTSEANAAASATKAVESAQRGLANAQRALADARVQAARGVADAEKQVTSAERDLSDAQRNARQVQMDLTSARQDAARSLEDMNNRLADARLSEKEAVLRQAQAEKDLKAAQQNPGTTPEQLQRLQLSYDEATQALKEQRTETKRLSDDTAKANKAGVEGSQQVVDAKQKIADANRAVQDKERALADAQAGVAQARADGQRQIEDAQRGVAEAAQAVAEAQQAAASQTTKLGQAMAKLSPNARSFVKTIQGLAPAWDGMRLSVQNRLFAGLDTTVAGLAHSTIPILQRQLTATAGIWNSVAKNAAAGVQEMAKSGTLDKILKGANDNLKAFANTPKQLIAAFGQLSVAAQPAFNGLMKQLAGFITSFTQGISAAFASGGLQDAISTAFQLIGQLGTLLGNTLGVITSIGKAASDAGGQIIGVLGNVMAELNTLLKSPQMQASLRSLFASVSQIVGAIVPVIGSVVQAVVPLLAAIAQPIAQVATVLGPVLAQLATTLGAALMPIVQALGPVLVTVGTAIVQIVQSVMPLLQPIATLITSVVSALAPALTPIINVVTGLVSVLVGPLTQVVQALTPVLVTVGQIITQVFQALEPFLTPLVSLLGQVAGLIAGVFASALTQLMGALQPLIPVGMQLITTVLNALAPILPTIGKAFGVIAQALLSILGPLGQVMASLAQQLAPVLGLLAPVIGQIATLFADSLARILPPLATAFLSLVTALTPILPLLGQLVGMVLQMAAGVLVQLLPSILQLVQAGVQLALALVPLIPPLAQLVALVLNLAIKILNWLLPPLLKLVDFFVRNLVPVLTTVIGWVANLVTWMANHLGPAFTKLRDLGIAAWGKLKDGISTAWDAIKTHVIYPIRDFFTKTIPGWGDALKDKLVGAFDAARAGIKLAWDKVKGIAKTPVQYVVDVVYNKGIVGVWNKVAGAFGAPKLDTFKFASGGIMPGYTPGRDVHKFLSPTGGVLELSGGEAIMRPEFTRAVGSGFVSMMNALAKSRGSAGVKAALAPLLGGNPHTPTDRSLKYADGGVYPVQRFADGGIFGWIKSAGSAVAGAGTKAWNTIKKSASWLTDTLEASARAGVKHVVDPLLKNFPGMDAGFGKLVRNIPDKIINALFGYSKEADKRGAGGLGGPRIQAALKWAKSQNGKPYQWAGNGNPSWDCSGFMSAIESVIRGQKPHRRWATMAFSGHTAPPGWVYHGNSPFRIGITNAGVGHTAGTLGGVNVESSGGLGVHYGRTARGYKDPLFTSWYGFMPGKYDSGGYLQPGLNLAFNGTGRPEPVLTSAQWQTMSTATASGGLQAGDQLRLVVDGHEFSAYVDTRANGRVAANNTQILTALKARPRG